MKSELKRVFMVFALCFLCVACCSQSSLWALEDLEVKAIHKKLDTISDQQKTIQRELSEIKEELRIVKIRVTKQ